MFPLKIGDFIAGNVALTTTHKEHHLHWLKLLNVNTKKSKMT